MSPAGGAALQAGSGDSIGCLLLGLAVRPSGGVAHLGAPCLLAGLVLPDPGLDGAGPISLLFTGLLPHAPLEAGRALSSPVCLRGPPLSGTATGVPVGGGGKWSLPRPGVSHRVGAELLGSSPPPLWTSQARAGCNGLVSMATQGWPRAGGQVPSRGVELRRHSAPTHPALWPLRLSVHMCEMGGRCWGRRACAF